MNVHRKRSGPFDVAAPFGDAAAHAPLLVARVLPVLHALCLTIALFGATLLVPLVVAHVAQDGSTLAFDEALLVTLGVGTVGWLATRRPARELQPRDAYLLVGLAWTVLPAFATLPLLEWSASAGQPMSFTDAYFEAVSGVTTTGATVMTGLDALPAAINLWRCLLVWLGGMGILVLAVAILPLLGVAGSQVFKAETPGPMKDTKLTPRITETAKGLYTVYALLTLACMGAYRLAGMSTFDAVCHAFSTMGLGGFSTHDASFGAFADRPAVAWVAVVFMVVASVNFSIHFLAFRQRSAGPYRRCPEARWVLLTLAAGSATVCAYLVATGAAPGLDAVLRDAVFNTVSIASTTGFVSTDYERWPAFVPALMLFLSCFATSSGSTGGGIKMIRAVVLFKQTRRELTRSLHPRMIDPVRIGRTQADATTLYSILAFMLLYGLTVIVGTFLLLATGLDEKSAFSAVIACINNTGPGLGEVGPGRTYAGLTDAQTWVCTAMMLLGRLELVTLLVLFTPAFWRK